MPTMHIHFLGAAGTVTGSKYLIEHGGRRILLDCGLFQGYKHLRLRNREPLPVPVDTLDAVIVSHAHLDHSGWLPVLAREGYRGPIYSSAPTAALCQVLLRDSAHLMGEEAEHANRHGWSKHEPALPLYEPADAEAALQLFQPLPWHIAQSILPGITLTLRRAGHMLGAAMVHLQCDAGSLLFSGDLGRPQDPILRPLEAPPACDWLLVESTYGDRLHPPEHAGRVLSEVVTRTVARGGTLIIPAFAVGRAQALLYHLARLKRDGRIPDVPVYLNSPMAAEATEIYLNFADEHRLSAGQMEMLRQSAEVVASADASKRLNSDHEPKIIVAASGMATGGRVLHHLKAFAPDPRNTILFSGFQSGGTRGALMVAGARSIRIYGEDVPIRAEVLAMEELSSHADSEEIMTWLRQMPGAPRQSFVVHGEPAAADNLRRLIAQQLHWPVAVAEHGQCLLLSGQDACT